MYMYSSFDRLPAFPDYDAALKHYNRVKPIKGRGANGGRKPIGERRYVDKFYMGEGTYNNKPTIKMYLYDTPCVEYVRGGEIILCLYGYGGNLSTDAKKFMSSLIPAHELTTIGGVDMLVSGKGRQALSFKHTHVILAPDETGWLKVTRGGKTLYKHKLIRKKFNPLVSKCKPFIEHVQNLLKLQNLEELLSTRSRVYLGTTLQERVSNITPDMSTWDAELMQKLMGSCVERKYTYEDGFRTTYHARPERVATMVRDALKTHYAAEIFEATEVDPDLWRGDSNAKYTTNLVSN